MKKTVFAAAICAAWAASALEVTSLDGLWDFAFSENATVKQAKADFSVTGRMTVPGCYDLMPKWYARRGLGSYRRAFFRGGADIRTKPAGFNMAGLFDAARRSKLAAMTVKKHYESIR